MKSLRGEIMRSSFRMEYDLPYPILDSILVVGNIYSDDDGRFGIGIEHVWLHEVDITRSVDLEEIERLVREDIQ